MANAVTAKKGKIDRKNWTVKGDTLDEIQEYMFNHQIGGTDAVADCQTSVTAPGITKFDEKEVAKPKKKGTVEYTVTPKPGLKVELSALIRLPQLQSDKKLTDPAKKEWARFRGALSAHEDLHLEKVWGLAEKIAKELSAITGRGAGKDKKAAINAAKADFAKQVKAKGFDASGVTKQVKAVHAKVDSGGKGVFTLDVNKQ